MHFGITRICRDASFRYNGLARGSAAAYYEIWARDDFPERMI